VWDGEKISFNFELGDAASVEVEVLEACLIISMWRKAKHLLSMAESQKSAV